MLANSIFISLEPFLIIEIYDLICILKILYIHKKTHDSSPSATFAMITMEYNNIFLMSFIGNYLHFRYLQVN